MRIVWNPSPKFAFADNFMDADTGQMFSESPHYREHVSITDVCVGLLGKSAWEGAAYLDGGGEAPNLGRGLSYEGSSRDFLTMAIHPIDLPKFVQRVWAWRAVTENVVSVRLDDGTFEVRKPYKRELGEAADLLDKYRRDHGITRFTE